MDKTAILTSFSEMGWVFHHTGHSSGDSAILTSFSEIFANLSDAGFAAGSLPY